MTLDRDKLAKILGLLGSAEGGEIISAGRAAHRLIRDADTTWANVLNRNLVADEADDLLAEYNTLRETAHQLWGRYESVCETAHQLVVENNALRKKAARRLAAGILLTLGVVTFLSVHGGTMFVDPSVRSGTVASSGQETPEAVARSGGLPTQVERRGGISSQPSSVEILTPETMPQPPPEAAVAPVEDSATQPATPAVAALGQTAQAPEAPQSTTSFAPEEEQVTLPGTSDTISPPPTQSPPNRHLSAAEIAALVTRGDSFLGAGDIASARLFYERAADGGDGNAALRLGTTFDPGFFSRTGIRGARSDPTQASSWYRRALDLGNSAAQEALRDLEQRRFAAPGSPSH